MAILDDLGQLGLHTSRFPSQQVRKDVITKVFSNNIPDGPALE